MDATLHSLIEQVRAAAAGGGRLCIRAGGTKDFYGNAASGVVLDTRPWAGIVAYEPSELVITARAGTPLAEVEAAVDAAGQMIAFEPPHFGAGATFGGCIAAGLAGPRRMAAGYAYGSVRDFVLGARLLDGRGRLLSFGGTVIKNVAGYDAARVLAGSLGILGVILEVSLKVVPKPAAETTLAFEMDEAAALARMNEWGGRPLPISATAWADGRLRVRLSGARAAVEAAQRTLGGELLDASVAREYWLGVREQRDGFFAGDAPLWRLSLPSTAPSLGLAEPGLIEWGGAQRWVRTTLPAESVRSLASGRGGHATLFRGGDRSTGVFTPLTPVIAGIHRGLRAEFDPHGVFDAARMYAGL